MNNSKRFIIFALIFCKKLYSLRYAILVESYSQQEAHIS